MLRGRARFTVDGNEHELGPGQLVFVRDPALRRGAVALDADTVVLALGGKPGVAHTVSAWEAMFAAVPASRAEDWDEAIRIHQEALEEQPEHGALLYNLACMEARGGRRLDALLHLQRAVELEPKWAEYASQGLRLRRDQERARLPGQPDRRRRARAAPARDRTRRARRAAPRRTRPPGRAHRRALQADGERERLVRLRPAERHELLRAGAARPARRRA